MESIGSLGLWWFFVGWDDGCSSQQVPKWCQCDSSSACLCSEVAVHFIWLCLFYLCGRLRYFCLSNDRFLLILIMLLSSFLFLCWLFPFPYAWNFVLHLSKDVVDGLSGDFYTFVFLFLFQFLFFWGGEAKKTKFK